MASGTLKPSDANCDAWYTTSASEPDTVANIKTGTNYSSGQRATVSTAAGTVKVQNVYSAPPGGDSTWHSAQHLFQLRFTETPLSLTGKVWYDRNYGDECSLYIKDDDGSTWELLDSNSAPAPEETVLLSGSPSGAMANYLDGSDDAYLCITSNTEGPSYCEAKEVNLDYTYSGGGGGIGSGGQGLFIKA